MTVKKWKRSGTKKHSMSDREIRNGLLSEKAAEEGIVLLKNDKKILPLNISTKIGLYGAGAGKTVKGGTGSGDVNNRSNISIYQGLKENGIQIVSEKWLANYESIYAEARRAWKEKILEEAKFVENPFDAYAENPFAMPEGRAVTAEDTVDAQTAIYVVSRISGEGKDRRRVEGDYYLSRRDREDIRFLDAQKIPTVLIMNSGGPVELTDILEETENICAVLNISQLGQRGGLALANVLLGKVTPGGKLTATWARRYEDYPCAEEDPLPGAKEFLDELRSFSQVILISDTFTQFATPLMEKLGWPTLFCNSLEVAENGEITGFKMRCEKSKLTTVKALQSMGFETIASGDSYNDLGMIQASKAGFLFRSTEQIRADHPEIPAYEEYDELLAAIREAMK